MIFLGDIANPNFYKANKNVEINNIFKDKLVIANLEGDLTINNDFLKKNVVFNSMNTLDLLNEFNIKVVNLANNHILDTSETVRETIEILKKSKISTIGAGLNEFEASRHLEFSYGGDDYAFFSYGWDLIGCRKPNSNKSGVNLYEPSRNIVEIRNYINNNKEKKVVVLLHWNYELEIYPQPMDRQFAHDLIDLGVEAVIGCHSHCVQGIEVYKNKPIIYSLGNWLFPNGKYFDGKLIFPEISNLQIAIELINGEVICHWHQKLVDGSVVFLNSEDLNDSKKIKELTPYQSYSPDRYISFFREHRRKKNLLPVFYNYNHEYRNLIKKKFVQFRHIGIKTVLNLGLKGGPK